MKTFKILFYILFALSLNNAFGSEGVPKKSSVELVVLKKNNISELAILSHVGISIEKKDVIGMKDLGNKLQIVGKKEGATALKIGNSQYKVVVANDETYNSYLKLNALVKFCPSLELSFEDNIWKISGTLDDPSTWLSFAKLKITHYAFQASVLPSHLRIVEYELNREIKKLGFFPVRIFIEPTPTVRLPSSTSADHQIRDILGQFGIAIKEDKKRLYTEPLIRVQLHLAEVRKSFSQNIGIEWPYQYSAKIIPFGVMPTSMDLNAFANFFASKGHGKILASPNLITKSGSEADFFAGGEFPIKTKTNLTHSVTWKKYGITLKIKPYADPDGKISLDLSSEVSTLDPGEKIDGIPSLFTNTISSHFDLVESQTLILSGLVKKIDGESLKLWPGIGEIPILGALFTSRDFQEDKTELVVLVTPTIVHQNN